MMAVQFEIELAHRLAIPTDFSAFRNVQAAKNFCQRRFSTAVSASDESQFSGMQRQIYRPENETAVLTLAMIAVSHIHQREAIPTARGNRADACFLLFIITGGQLEP